MHSVFDNYRAIAPTSMRLTLHDPGNTIGQPWIEAMLLAQFCQGFGLPKTAAAIARIGKLDGNFSSQCHE
jgi:hypothetical protein